MLIYLTAKQIERNASYQEIVTPNKATLLMSNTFSSNLKGGTAKTSI